MEFWWLLIFTTALCQPGNPDALISELYFFMKATYNQSMSRKVNCKVPTVLIFIGLCKLKSDDKTVGLAEADILFVSKQAKGRATD